MWTRVLQRTRAALTSKGTAAFLFAAVAVGVLVGVGASLLVTAIEVVGNLVGKVAETGDVKRFAPLVLVPIGIVVAWLIARRLGSEIEGDGVPETMAGLSLHGGYLPTRTIAGKIAATASTIGFGGSAGREGPVVQVGATIGSAFGRYARFGDDQIRSLIAAGAGAGIGASFNAPIAGMLFAMEVILGGFSVRHLNAVVVASVSAAVTTRTLVGEERLLSAPAHSLGSPQELILYVVLGVIIAVASVLFLRVIGAASGLASRRWRSPWVRPAIGGLVIAAFGIADPDLLGTGQQVVASLVRLPSGSDSLWIALVLVGLAKTIAVGVTINSGGSGGAFMPSLFVGSHLGAALALLVAPAWSFSTLDPGAFAVVGMAGAFAAMGRAPLTSILIVFEITGDYGLVLPLMLTTSLATFISERFHKDSVYSLPLTRRGIHLARHEDIDLLDLVTVGEVMTTGTTPLRTGMTTAEVLRIFNTQRHHGLAVVDDERLVGLVTLHDIQRAGGASPDMAVEDVMVTKPVTVTASMPVSAALARMAALGIGRMPVVAEDDAQKLLGMFRRESVVRAYHHALGTATDRGVYRERLKARVSPGAAFFELPVPVSSAAAGSSVRDLTWPEDATLVSIRRGGSVIIPHGDTTLSVGDTITAFGSSDARVELAFMLQPVGDESGDAGLL